jgi:hypothetical protein
MSYLTSWQDNKSTDHFEQATYQPTTCNSRYLIPADKSIDPIPTVEILPIANTRWLLSSVLARKLPSLKPFTLLWLSSPKIFGAASFLLAVPASSRSAVTGRLKTSISQLRLLPCTPSSMLLPTTPGSKRPFGQLGVLKQQRYHGPF